MRLAHLPKANLRHARQLNISVSTRTLQRSKKEAQKLLPFRFFTHTDHLRQKDRPNYGQSNNFAEIRPEAPDRLRSGTIQKPQNGARTHAPKTDDLLSEQTVSNKEQRKADWAIIKEMSRYLWPKVWSPEKRRSLKGLTVVIG